MRWRKVTLLGVGLLGGSLGLALKKHGLAKRVHGYVRRAASIDECVQAGAVDSASCELEESVQGADLIVLCTPLAQMAELARSSLSATEPGTLITDVGSVKGPLVAELEPMYETRKAIFVGSHPMAGSEKMGVSAARADLFQAAVCVVTPSDRTNPQDQKAVEQLWQGVGARTMSLSPEDHDALVARSSHLPHVLAANLAAYVLNPKFGPEQGGLCANGFRDSTRIASGSPEMWRDIILMNQTHLKRALGEYKEQLEQFETLVREGNPATIENFFRKTKTLRDTWRTKCSTATAE